MKKKIDPLETFLLKGHRPFCTIKNFSDHPRHCSCGYEEALKRYYELKEMENEQQSNVGSQAK